MFFFVSADEYMESNVPHYRELLRKIFVDDSVSYLAEIIKKEVINIQDSTSVREQFKQFTDVYRKKKKRWVKSALDSEKASPTRVKRKEFLLYKEKISKDFDSHTPELFKRRYNQVDAEAVIQEMREALSTWGKDKNALLTQYPLFDYMDIAGQENAIHDSILYEVFSYFVVEYDANIHNVIEERPDILISKPIMSADNKRSYKFDVELVEREIPVDFGYDNSQGSIGQENNLHESTQQTLFEIDSIPVDTEIVTTSKKMRFKKSGYETEDVILETLFTETYTINHVVRYMEEFDLSILNEILKQRDSLYLMERNIVVDINSITLNLYGGNKKNRKVSQAKYNDVRNRIIKIANLYFNFVDKDTNRAFGFNLFSRYQEIKSGNGNLMMVTVGDALFDDFNKYRTTRLYKIELDRLKGNPLAKTITYAMQKQRTFMYLNKIEGSYTCNYKYFLVQAQFTDRSKTRNLKKIEECLDDIVNAGIVIDSYTRSGETFKITFKEMRQHEIQDLVKDQQRRVNTAINVKAIEKMEHPYK